MSTNHNLLQTFLLQNSVSSYIYEYLRSAYIDSNIENIFSNIPILTPTYSPDIPTSIPILVQNYNLLSLPITNIQQINTDYVQAIENSLQENSTIIKKNILSEKGKQTLKTVLFNNALYETKICPITQTPFTHHEKITQLPCKHIFKSKAIIHWLEKEKAECPVCRAKLPSKEVLTSNNINTISFDNHPFF